MVDLPDWVKKYKTKGVEIRVSGKSYVTLVTLFFPKLYILQVTLLTFPFCIMKVIPYFHWSITRTDYPFWNKRLSNLEQVTPFLTHNLLLSLSQVLLLL
jgi:hypothetical protein